MKLFTFPPATYRARRAALKEKLGSGLLFFPGNELVPYNYAANTYPIFRQDSSFLYYFGLELPGLNAVLDTESGESILFGHEPDMDDIIWEGPLPSLSDLAALAGIERAQAREALPDFLKKAQAAGRNIHFLPPYRHDIQLRLAEWLACPVSALPEKASLPLTKAVVAQRLLKTPEEIEQMELAHVVTREQYLHAMQNTRPGLFEYEIVGGIKGIAGKHNCDMAYGIIFSVNGEILHNHSHDNKMREGQLVLGDFGVENRMRYASDLTRTWPVGKKFTQQQAEIYEIVLNAHESAAQMMRPGVLYRDCHLHAWQIIASGLKELGILRGDPAEMTALGVPGLFMPHGLGHQIGLDVHDLENLGEQHIGYRPGLERSSLLGLKSLRFARELEVGHVLTVEPGIYFIPPLQDRWEAEGKFKDFIQYKKLRAYRKFGGVRLEDNYLVTESGTRMLGKKPVPKHLKAVEALRG